MSGSAVGVVWVFLRAGKSVWREGREVGQESAFCFRPPALQTRRLTGSPGPRGFQLAEGGGNVRKKTWGAGRLQLTSLEQRPVISPGPRVTSGQEGATAGA